jgi:hypothetical protein
MLDCLSIDRRATLRTEERLEDTPGRDWPLEALCLARHGELIGRIVGEDAEQGTASPLTIKAATTTGRL